MRKSIIIKSLWPCLIIMTSIIVGAQAQKSGSVGIGTTSPDESAILDLSSKNQGLLLPRMSLDERMNIQNPANGLMIYQTNLLSGVYVYNGTQWQAVSGVASEAKLVAADNSVWGTGGNAGLSSATHFIGTTDTTNLIFKVNDFRSGIIDYKRGNTILGYKAASTSNPYNSVILGSLSMQKTNTTGNTIAIGFQSLFSHESGDHNISIGSGSLAANAAGEKNTAIGSLAGYKSQGNRNVFIGFQSGYFEQESDKLHIANDASRKPLIYGDFATNKLGINTTNLSSVLNVNSGIANTSGLRFEMLNLGSPVQSPNSKVLSLNATGEVILVNDQEGPNHWNFSSNNITNNNTGNVIISNDLNVGRNMSVTGTLGVKSLRVGATGLKFDNLNSSSPAVTGNAKVLSLDEAGNVILVNDIVGTIAPPNPTPTTGTDLNWGLDASGNILNKNTGDVNVAKNINTNGIYTYFINVGWGGIRFKELTSATAAFPANGKSLSIDEFGNVILVNNPASTGGGGTTVTDQSSIWGKDQNGYVYTYPGNKVIIGEGITNLPSGYNLYVRKGILAERVRVAVANSDKWADYVFADNYKLMPLKEVETFIKKEKHLPNVASAEQISKEGIDLAEIAAKQMEKIEELTLYLIDANKRIEALEQKLAGD